MSSSPLRLRLLLLERSRTFSNLLCNFSSFPGGLNKCLQKKEKEKQQMLPHEKQLYVARIRSLIGRKSDRPFPSDAQDASTTHSPMTITDPIKSRADRFMRNGADDLWNENDDRQNPQRTRRKNPKIEPSTLDLRKNGSDGRKAIESGRSDRPSSHPSDGKLVTAKVRVKDEQAINQLFNLIKFGPDRRNFSSFSLRDYSVTLSSDDENEDDDENDGKLGLEVRGNPRWWRFRRNMMSGAALRMYVSKMKTKRQPLKIVEEASGSIEGIQYIRDELKRMVLDGNAERSCDEGESLHSQKRYVS